MPISDELLTAIEHYLDHSATAEETQLVNSWYHSFNDRKLIINTHEQNLKSKIDAMIRARLAETTGIKRITETPVHKIDLSPIRKWAVAAIILIVSGLVFYTYKMRTADSLNALAHDIGPGRNVARLTLANGRKIILSDAQEGKLAEESGVRISKAGNGQIIYTIVNEHKGAKDHRPEMNTIETPKGGQYQVNLPDGSRVWLNAASSLRYPSRFSAEERKVELSGEAYFEIAKVFKGKDTGKADKERERLPFVVKTASQLVEVLGTHFNINSYGDETAVKTTLLEGSVKVKPLTFNNAQFLKPGQQAVLEGGSLKIKEADLSAEMAWKNGEFVFASNDFHAEMRKVARWYNVDIVYDDSAPADFNLGGFISRSKNISAVLKLIELTGKVHFKIEGRRILVTK